MIGLQLRTLYTLLHYLAIPLILARLAWRGIANPAYFSRWRERFGYGDPLPSAGATFWVHAVSVGEVQAALPLVRALRARHADAAIVVTTTTPTGMQRVSQALGEEVVHRYVPYDLPGAMRRFLRRVRPRVAIIFETEIWPNLVHLCAGASVPVIFANARLSARSATGYRRLGRLIEEVLGEVTAVAAQSRDDAKRLEMLGVDPARIVVTGSVKFDVKLPASVNEAAQVMRRTWGVDRSIWIAASTHEGEDEQIIDAYRHVRHEVPDSLLVLVPRHPERFAKTAALCRRRGFRVSLRSEAPESCADADVFIGDTMGELPVFYGAADVAFVGGSLVDIGGHNMLEPAALGLPVVLGPYLYNFADISRQLLACGAAVRVADSAELGRVVVRFLRDANLRHGTGERGQQFVAKNRGALDRLVELVERYAGPSPGRDARPERSG